MNKRQSNLIKILKNKDWLTGGELANILNVSSRTIRNDIKNINKENGSILIKSSKKFGYHLNSDFEKTNMESVVYNNHNLKSLILKDLLKSHKKIYYQDIINKYFISDSTLNSILSEINKDIKKVNSTSIKRQGDLLYIDGNELSIRIIYKDLLFKETQDNIFNLNELAKHYQHFDLIKIKSIFEKVLNKYEYKIDEAYFPILILHIGVSLDRLFNGNPAETSSLKDYDIYYLKNTEEYTIAKEFFSRIKKYYNLAVYESEVILLTLNIINKKVIDQGLVSINKKLLLTIKNALNYVDYMTGINLTNDTELIKNLYMHISNLLVRLNKEKSVNRLYYEDIKNSYPYIFEIALIWTNYIQKSLGLEIPEEEVTFIALHLGSSYKNCYNKKYKTILILPKTGAISNNIIEKINSTFSQELEIRGVYNYFEENMIKDMDIDIIISTINLSHNLDIPTVYCSVFFSKDDEINIFKTLREIEEDKLKKDYTNHLIQLLDKDHFYQGYTFKDKYDLLKFLCNKLYVRGEVDDSYYNKVIERESYSPTSFAQGFAIPHSYEPLGIKKSSISILLLNNPIIRDKYEVNIVFLLTIKREDNPILQLFFSWMDKLCKDITTLSKVSSSINFEEFIDNFNPDS
ncbi:MAG: PRD domain-containing protein [Anaerococcus sp.]|nr:PRD domain-containing protein [Anaerococcus sp.]MDD7043982.1 PRD domain-containing protein [Peptoniphilaceae bacterium]MDY2919634.1 PRD domain-containing protein [Anaerococcus sp.]